MKRTNYYFTEEQVERLKAVKEKTGVPVSVMIRLAIEAYLKSLEG